MFGPIQNYLDDHIGTPWQRQRQQQQQQQQQQQYHQLYQRQLQHNAGDEAARGKETACSEQKASSCKERGQAL